MSLTRRDFIRTGAVLGAAAAAGRFPAPAQAEPLPGLAVAHGQDYFQATLKAVEALGGIKRFIPAGARVGLLINCPFGHHGAHVNPTVAQAALQLLAEAGAKSVVTLKNPPSNYWSRGARGLETQAALALLKPTAGEYVPVKVPGQTLKEVRVVREYLEAEVLVNLTVAKDHAGIRYSCLLKNTMGALDSGSCRYFHHGSGASGWYDDVDHLARCVAEVNLIRKPNLCLVDGTEVLATNGPSGPGKVLKPQRVLAGLDPVAADAYAARFVNLQAIDLPYLKLAEGHKLGRADLGQVRVVELEA